MNVVFFEVDNVLNFDKSEAKAPSGRVGIAESRVKALKKRTDKDGSKLVLIGNWKKDWSFDDSKCTSDGIYLNKKLDRRGLHILDKTKDMESVHDEVDDWLKRHPNVEAYEIITNGDVLENAV